MTEYHFLYDLTIFKNINTAENIDDIFDFMCSEVSKCLKSVV